MDPRLNLTPVVAIVGRTNVGKSTMFNRLIERRRAITSPEENTTRDISYDHFHWSGLTMTAVDTAGLDLTSDSATDEALKRQAQLAMQKADIILMLVDAETGLMPQDRALAKYLRQHEADKPILLLANKADNPKMRKRVAAEEWRKLGMGQPLPCSASNGTGVGDMLDVLVAKVRELGLDSRPIPEPDLKMILIGRPNVGKSSLLNALAGEDRVIVSEVRHTTREPQDTMLTYVDEDGSEKNVLVMDTVGIRKKSRVTRGIEYIGVGKSFREMREADIALLMVDAAEGIGSQDKKLIGLIDRNRVGIIVLANKWDVAEEERLGDAEAFRRHLEMMLPFCSWAPIAYISALTGRNVEKIVPMALRVMRERQKRLSQEELDAFLVKMKKIHGNAFKEGPNRPKVYGINQTATEPPQFELVVRKKEVVHPNFLRFVEKRLREEFGFEGTPIRLEARQISRGKQV